MKMRVWIEMRTFFLVEMMVLMMVIFWVRSLVWEVKVLGREGLLGILDDKVMVLFWISNWIREFCRTLTSSRIELDCVLRSIGGWF